MVWDCVRVREFSNKHNGSSDFMAGCVAVSPGHRHLGPCSRDRPLMPAHWTACPTLWGTVVSQAILDQRLITNNDAHWFELKRIKLTEDGYFSLKSYWLLLGYRSVRLLSSADLFQHYPSILQCLFHLFLSIDWRAPFLCSRFLL